MYFAHYNTEGRTVSESLQVRGLCKIKASPCNVHIKILSLTDPRYNTYVANISAAIKAKTEGIDVILQPDINYPVTSNGSLPLGNPNVVLRFSSVDAGLETQLHTDHAKFINIANKPSYLIENASPDVIRPYYADRRLFATTKAPINAMNVNAYKYFRTVEKLILALLVTHRYPANVSYGVQEAVGQKRSRTNSEENEEESDAFMKGLEQETSTDSSGRVSIC